MPHLDVIWTEGPDGNVEHLAENNVSPDEAEDVLNEPLARDTSRSSGRPIVFGITRSGRKIAVVYEQIDRVTVYPITAYDVS